MKSLSEIELEIPDLQRQREHLVIEHSCTDGVERETAWKELKSVDRRLARLSRQRTELRAQRHASGFGWLGDYSRG
jgi:hypothetical protein